MEYEKWKIEYEKWHDKARVEFIESEYYEVGIEDDFEIAEDGTVYMGNMHYIKKAVTPWFDSEYFVE